MGLNQIKKMSMRDIITEIGMPIYFDRSILKYNIPHVEINEIIEKLKQYVSTGDVKELLKFAEEKEEFFDKESFIFQIGRTLEEELQNSTNTLNSAVIPGNLKKRMSDKDFLEYIKNMLKESDIIHAIPLARSLKETERDLPIYDIYSSLKFSERQSILVSRANKAERKLQQIENVLGMRNVVENLSPIDFEINKYPNFAKSLATALATDKNGIIENMDEIARRVPNAYSRYSAFDLNKFEECTREYFLTFDSDKMLLLANASYYMKCISDLENLSQDDAKALLEFTRKVESLLDSKLVSVNSYRLQRSFNFIDLRKSVEELNNRFINGKYLTDIQLDEVKQKILSGVYGISNISKDKLLNTLQFSQSDFEKIAASNPKTLEQLVENSLLNEKDILNLYMQGKISLDNVRTIKERIETPEILEQFGSEDKLVNLYLQPERDEKEFLRYARLYRLLKVEDKSLQEQCENAINILEQSLELIDENKIHELYHIGLIPWETAIEYSENATIANLYKSGIIKPVDAKRLYKQGVLKLDSIKEVLASKDIDDGQKLALIYSTFSSKEDKLLREELVSCINDVKGPLRKDENTHSGQGHNTDDTTANKNKFLTDPCARWNLMANIDKDYSQEYFEDGHIIFYMPNQGKYVIEKLYDTNRRFAYGAATYIMDEETFNINKEQIICGKKINRDYFINQLSEEQRKKIVHTGWGNEIIRYFDLENPSKYTKEQIEEIQQLAREVEESRTQVR